MKYFLLLVISFCILSTLHSQPQFMQLIDHGIEAGYDKNFNWIDINNDGRKELIIANGNITAYSFDQSSNSFTKIDNLLSGDISYIRGLSLGDFDNDGFIDLYAYRYTLGANGGYPYPLPNVLYRNNGNGTFIALPASNISLTGSATLQSDWIDINNDGYLDLFTVNNIRDKAFLNNGDGTFSEMRSNDFDEKRDWVYSTYYYWIDLNQDGFIDYIANQNLETDVMLNVGGNRFEKHGLLEFFNIKSWSWPSAIHKFASGTLNGRECMLMLDQKGVFFLKTGNLYNQSEMPKGLEYRNAAQGGEFIDVDNDGDLDSFLSGENVYNIRSDIFNQNSGDTVFIYRPEQFSGYSREFTFHDFNNDFAVDLIRNNFTADVYQNTSSQNGITIRLEGNISSTFGTGARVALKANNKWQYQTITTNAGSSGKVEYEASFGIQMAEFADSVIVNWPSGCQTVTTKLSHSQTHRLREACSGSAPAAINMKICAGEQANVNLGPDGRLFQWFTSLSSESISVSGTNVIIDTLTKSQTLFVANADSTLLSRKTPVHIEVIQPPNYSLEYTWINNQEIRFTLTNNNEIDTYLWTVNDIEQSTNHEFTYSIFDSGSIEVCVEAYRKSCSIKKCTVLTIADIPKHTKPIEIFPNPVSKVLTITLPTEQVTQVRIFNMMGAEVFSANSEESVIEIDFSNFSLGIYIVQINNGQYFSILKI